MVEKCQSDIHADVTDNDIQLIQDLLSNPHVCVESSSTDLNQKLTYLISTFRGPEGPHVLGEQVSCVDQPQALGNVFHHPFDIIDRLKPILTY